MDSAEYGDWWLLEAKRGRCLRSFFLSSCNPHAWVNLTSFLPRVPTWLRATNASSLPTLEWTMVCLSHCSLSSSESSMLPGNICTFLKSALFLILCSFKPLHSLYAAIQSSFPFEFTDLPSILLKTIKANWGDCPLLCCSYMLIYSHRFAFGKISHAPLQGQAICLCTVPSFLTYSVTLP